MKFALSERRISIFEAQNQKNSGRSDFTPLYIIVPAAMSWILTWRQHGQNLF